MASARSSSFTRRKNEYFRNTSPSPMTACAVMSTAISTPASLTFIIVFVGIVSSVAADAGYLVLIPLAGIAFLSVGRHPLAGIAAGFASVYRELCAKFRALVDVLEEIAARGLVQNGPTGTLKVYESWVRTGNDKLEQVLVDAGLVMPKGLPN